MINADAINHALTSLSSHTESIMDGSGRYIIWRHQRYGDRRPTSDNAAGEDPDRQDFYTTDRIVKARYLTEKEDDYFYGKFVPAKGDLLITLRGNPTTPQAAKKASAVGFYRVIRVNEYRTRTGDLIHAQIEVMPDDSGRWAS